MGQILNGLPELRKNLTLVYEFSYKSSMGFASPLSPSSSFSLAALLVQAEIDPEGYAVSTRSW